MKGPPIVVVGAGVAGCVAARTLADAGCQVLVLEAGPGRDRPAVLNGLDHLRSVEAGDWWYPDLPKRGRGLGGSSAVNGMVLDAIHPLDIKRWGWDDALEHQRWLLDRWPNQQVASGPLTDAFGARVREGFPSAPSTTVSGWSGWAPLSLAFDGSTRSSAADAFLTEPVLAGANPVEVRNEVPVSKILAGGRHLVVELTNGEQIEAAKVLLAAGNVGSPAVLVASGMVAVEDVATPSNHASTAIVVELEEHLRVGADSGGTAPPSSHLLRTVSGLSENTVDLQMLVLDHTGSDDGGRRHGAVIVSALEPDRQKVLVAGLTQALHWLRAIDGVIKVSLSGDPCPVQHHACSLAGVVIDAPDVHVIDGSVLPALPHTNPMLSVAIGARRAALRLA